MREYTNWEIAYIGIWIAIGVAAVFAVVFSIYGIWLDNKTEKINACPVCGKADNLPCPCGY